MKKSREKKNHKQNTNIMETIHILNYHGHYSCFIIITTVLTAEVIDPF